MNSTEDPPAEPMDCSDSYGPQLPAEALMTLSQNKDEVYVTLSVQWSKGAQPQKYKSELQKVLQSWANNNKDINGDCTVLNASDDGSAVISFKPAPAMSELQKLSGQTLTTKDKKVTVTIMSVRVTPPPQMKTQIPVDASTNRPPSCESEPRHRHEQISVNSTAEEETLSCSVPVGHFWYMSHIYKEEMKRIEKENGVEIMAQVNVTFRSNQKDAGPQKAWSEFISVTQKCLGESEAVVIPLRHVDSNELKDALKVVQRKESKLLLSVTHEEMTACGPRQSQDAIIKSLSATRNSISAPQDTQLKVGMSIRDPLVSAGLTMEESSWELMNMSYYEQLAKIKTKFGVDLKESGISQGKVEVKAHYSRAGGNTSMESHAVRALLHLYQKVATSPLSSTTHHGAAGFSGSPSEGSVANKQAGDNTDAPTGRGAAAVKDEDDSCSICMETFTNKKRLKCKHEFCEECLANAMKSLGPICPLCKDVFGMMEGDQPDGKMKWYLSSVSLPGFPGCSTITIDYHMFSGKQTEKHLNPGMPYSGIHRKAYLPDNTEGREVLRLLKKAFDQRLIFTIGTSRTTGMDNQVTWNDIHHKTSIDGGPQGFGYPDSSYLSRVRQELKAKGIE